MNEPYGFGAPPYNRPLTSADALDVALGSSFNTSYPRYPSESRPGFSGGLSTGRTSADAPDESRTSGLREHMSWVPEPEESEPSPEESSLEELVEEERAIQDRLDRLLDREPEDLPSLRDVGDDETWADVSLDDAGDDERRSTNQAAIGGAATMGQSVWDSDAGESFMANPHGFSGVDWPEVDVDFDELDEMLPGIVDDAGDMGISTSGVAGGLSGMNAEASPLDRLRDIADAGDSYQAGDDGIDYA